MEISQDSCTIIVKCNSTNLNARMFNKSDLILNLFSTRLCLWKWLHFMHKRIATRRRFVCRDARYTWWKGARMTELEGTQTKREVKQRSESNRKACALKSVAHKRGELKLIWKLSFFFSNEFD